MTYEIVKTVCSTLLMMLVVIALFPELILGLVGLIATWRGTGDGGR